jgi:hypothetical protein
MGLRLQAAYPLLHHYLNHGPRSCGRPYQKKIVNHWENIRIICCCLFGFTLPYYGLFANLLVCSLREREWERERLGYGFSINNWNAHVAPCKKHASVFVVNFCTLHIYSTCRSLFCFHSISLYRYYQQEFHAFTLLSLWSTISHLFISFCNLGR